MRSRVRWLGDAMFVAEAGSGHCVVLDGPLEAGGHNLGVRPMEMLLMGMGGCTAFDVVHILRKGRHAVLDCEAVLEAERAEKPPKVFTKIHVHFVVKGRGLSEDGVRRAISLSAEKYCSASLMLAKAVEITHDFELIDVE